ncbi:YchO/YchP family invasin [Entomohabitans teleogrylli]|uniref:YchO/YchP family invasin n=1 Tax=Entomohabitans teleogrylli TaxID=1384589 RepID=UPI00073D4945|nr:YchO/YchP family invasin [Entomohabitans teleogrylli]
MYFPRFTSRLAWLFLLTISGSVCASESSFIQQAQNPFDNDGDNLPDLALAPEDNAREQHIAEVVKSFGEASMTDNGLDTGEQARQFAFTRLRDLLAGGVAREAQRWLAPWGSADFSLLVDQDGDFTGSSGAFFVPLQDNTRWLTWSQLGLSQQDSGTVGNLGIGQRWISGDWLMGYNTFYDRQFDHSLQRAGLGAEAWGEYLRFSANYYRPLGDWRDRGQIQRWRMAQGYDVTAQAWLPFYRHINTTLSLEQYFGASVDLFNTGTGYQDPVAVKVGVSYTPVPLVTFTAQHKQGEKGLTQDNLGVKLNYRFGVPMDKQLSASEVAQARSLKGSRYDRVERSGAPVLEYQQRKTFSVFLATPPWEVKPGETLMLKLQIHSLHGIRQIAWQGDTQALSLTPPLDARSAEGWTVIVPQWQDSPEAVREWRLSATVEDNSGNKVTSNWITLKISQPFHTWPEDDSRFQLPPAQSEDPLLVNPDGGLDAGL